MVPDAESERLSSVSTRVRHRGTGSLSDNEELWARLSGYFCMIDTVSGYDPVFCFPV
jgi:hypothetical protein